MKIGLLLTAALTLLWPRSFALDIRTKDEFLDFSRRVTNGNRYKDETITLLNDIDFSGVEFEPMGIKLDNDDSSYFEGTFDGQGHIISNLNITSSEMPVGLFGYVYGGSVKNIVLDSSCIVSSVDSKENAFVGGVIGFLFSTSNSITVRNIVNMANIFAYKSKDTTTYIIGGIVGYISLDGNEIELYNCMNLGGIYFNESDEVNGNSSTIAIGGIAGSVYGGIIEVELFNCLNLGNIVFELTSSVQNVILIGGISGYVYRGLFLNCVNLGEFDIDVTNDTGLYVGGIAIIGYIRHDNCFSVDRSAEYGNVGYESEHFDDNFMILDEDGNYTGVSLMSKLEFFISKTECLSPFKWIINREGKNVTIFASKNNKKHITLSSKLILLPQLYDNAQNHFYGWYTDESFHSEFTANEIDKDITLYGKYDTCTDEYTITFNTSGKVEIEPLKVKFGDVIELLQEYDGEIIGKWEVKEKDNDFVDVFDLVEEKFVMPAYDVTLRAIWVTTKIKTGKDLKSFSDSVKSGMTYSGLTVTLEDDIDMNGLEVNQIGGMGLRFEGTFDGKGHVIKNLKLDSTSMNTLYAGLFGYSNTGMTVRNLVLDESYSITNELSLTTKLNTLEENSAIYIGGIIGYCYARKRECILENSVNMGNVEFHGDTKDYLLTVGGLAGALLSNSYYSKIRNSAFFGKAQSYGVLNTNSVGSIGGIAGHVGNYSGNRQCIIENCLNGGKIIYSGKGGSEHHLGGIVGHFKGNSFIQNCVNMGEFNGNGSDEVITGQIVGYAEGSPTTSVLIKNCYWKNDLGVSAYGFTKEIVAENVLSFYRNLTLKDSTSVGIYTGNSLISALNAYLASESGLSRWTGNTGKEKVSFAVDNKEPFSISSEVVLLTLFSSDEKTHFHGWFTDSEASTLFAEEEIEKPITLHGVWENAKAEYTVTLKNAGKVKKVSVEHGALLNEKIDSYSPKRNGHKFTGWTDEYGVMVDRKYRMPTRDLTLTAEWIQYYYGLEIKSGEDLKKLSDAVKRGISFDFPIIELKNDIDMGDITDFEPIGTEEHPFNGVFEGNGYRISNLTIKSPAKYVGLFGYSKEGLNVRNLILDETCSIESTFSSGSGSVGGVIGHCNDGESYYCAVVNVVNYASISATGWSEASSMTLGGIVGSFEGTVSSPTIVNCANYGSVTQRGGRNAAWIGGIAGRCKGHSADKECQMWNNVNYGKVSHAGEVSDPNNFGVGGIIGMCDELANVASCVSGGEIRVEGVRVSTIGIIVGKAADSCKSSDNFWFSRLSYTDNSGSNHMINGSLFTRNGVPVLEALRKSSSAMKFNDLEHKATWIINPSNATIKAEVNGRHIATYTDEIVLLPTFLGSDYWRFNGWYNGNDMKEIETSEVKEDTTFKGKREEIDYSVDDTKLVVAVVVIFVVIVVLIVLSSIYGAGFRKRRNIKKELRNLLYPEAYDEPEGEDSLNKNPGLYPEGYGGIKMREALRIAGLNEQLTGKVMSKCYENARKLGEEDKLPKNLTVDDAAALAMYTFDFGTKELYSYNPYRIINSALSERTEENIEKAKDLLYLVMKALRKLPVVHGVDLHRGIRADVLKNANVPQNACSSGLSRMGQGVGGQSLPTYTVGSVITWNALSSTSPDMAVTRTFLAGGSKTGNAAGTLFIIDKGWGYDIQPYSLFPTESEILVEPERQFKVVSYVPAELTIIKLEMLKTPVLLPDIFGKHDLDVSPIYFIKNIADKYEDNKRQKLKEERAKARGGEDDRETNGGATFKPNPENERGVVKLDDTDDAFSDDRKNVELQEV